MTGAVALIDFDRTLNDADSIMAELLDGLLGLTGQGAIEAFVKAHDLVHARHADRHDDLRLTFKVILDQHRAQGGGTTVREIQQRYQEAWDSSWRAPRLFPDAVPFLQGLKAQGYRLYLATGDHGPQKAQQLHRIAGERLLVDAFDPDTLGHQKGTREYVERALALAGASAGHTWAIGDSLRNDVAPALEAGLRALWLNRKSEQRRREDPLPTRTVPDLKQALAAILALEQELERPA